MRISYTATARSAGSGKLGAGELQAFLASVPPDADTNVHTESADRQGELDSWRVEASWTKEQQDAWLESLKPKPEVPAKRGGPGFGEQR